MRLQGLVLAIHVRCAPAAERHTVTALGYNKRIREVTPEGEAVLDFKPGGPGRTFRVVPIHADHPGLAALGVTAAGGGA